MEKLDHKWSGHETVTLHSLNLITLFTFTEGVYTTHCMQIICQITSRKKSFLAKQFPDGMVSWCADAASTN